MSAHRIGSMHHTLIGWCRACEAPVPALARAALTPDMGVSPRLNATHACARCGGAVHAVRLVRKATLMGRRRP